ncbi:uncharacterized protein CBL_02589 [Carabus blaptoides fortunei]
MEDVPAAPAVAPQEELVDIPVPINNDLERKIADAFEIFDHAGNKTVDVREIGTIIRSLGCVPTEAEIQEILVATENPAATGSVHLSKFLPHVSQIITEHKLQPAPPDKLLEAFRLLDQEGQGSIDKNYLSTLMMQEGEPFTQDEIDEMMATACDPQTQSVPYEYYINQLMYEPTAENDLYSLADIVQAKKQRRSKTLSQMLKVAQMLEESDLSYDFFDFFLKASVERKNETSN